MFYKYNTYNIHTQFQESIRIFLCFSILYYFFNKNFIYFYVFCYFQRRLFFRSSSSQATSMEQGTALLHSIFNTPGIFLVVPIPVRTCPGRLDKCQPSLTKQARNLSISSLLLDDRCFPFPQPPRPCPPFHVGSRRPGSDTTSCDSMISWSFGFA